MAKFLITAKYLDEGWKGVLEEGFSGRETYVRGLIESLGAKTEAWYWTYGDDDVLLIVDGDQASVLAISLAVNKSGAVEVSTTPLLTTADLDAARAKLPEYRTPGS